MSNPAFRFDHVHIISKDPLASANWYVEMLGATIAANTLARGASQIFVELGGMTILIRGQRPGEDPGAAKPIQRYAELLENLQWLARRIQTFGVHVHVGIRDGSKAIPIVNALAGYLPHFLALTASSPFWSGHDTGLDSSRSVIFGGLPTSGPPQPLADWSEFEDYMDTLLRAGTIRSIKEVWWDIRPHPDFGTVRLAPSAEPAGGRLAAVPNSMR